MSHRYDDVIAGAMTELAANVGERAPTREILGELTTAAVQLIDGVDCADVLLIENGEFNSIASTSPVAITVDQAQARTGEGPCIDAAERDVIVRCDDLRRDDRWP